MNREQVAVHDGAGVGRIGGVHRGRPVGGAVGGRGVLRLVDGAVLRAMGDGLAGDALVDDDVTDPSAAGNETKKEES